MSKRSLLVLLSAVCLVAAISPTSASAQWTHGGIELGSGENATIGAEGIFSFENETGGIECKNTISLTLVGGTNTGSVTSYQVHKPTKDCKTKGFLFLLNCEVEAVTPTGLPWVAHWKDTGAIKKTTGRIHYKLLNCPIEEIGLEPGEVDMAVSEAEMSAISAFTLEGTLESTAGAVAISGAYSLTEGSGTYGI